MSARDRAARVAIDVAILAAVLVIEIGPVVSEAPPWNVRSVTAFDVLRFAGFSLPLLFRRRWPVPVLATMIASFVGSEMLGFGLVVGFYSVGAHEDRNWVSRATAALGVIAVTAALIVYRDVEVPFDALIAVTVFTGAWLAGETMRLRRRYAVALQERALGFMQLAKEDRERLLAERRRLEAERDESERRAAARERARIARDLHDIVAHRVSMMTVQAGAARVVAEKDPDASRRAIGAVEDAGRQTLWELRKLLDVLRDDDAEDEIAPRPGLSQLERLATDVQAAGTTVRLTVLGDLSSAPEAVQLSAYRIVQEALTNVVKHAGPGAEADVVVQGSAEQVTIEVTDSGTGPSQSDLPGGYGIVGMRERAAVFGGTVDVGPRDGAGFFVRATLPTPPAR